MEFSICQRCRRLFWNNSRVCDRCGRELLLCKNTDAVYFIQDLHFSQAGVPALGAMEESLDSLFKTQEKRDRQAMQDAKQALERSAGRHSEKRVRQPDVPFRQEISQDVLIQQQKEREEQKRKQEEMRNRILQNRRKNIAAPDEEKTDDTRPREQSTAEQTPDRGLRTGHIPQEKEQPVRQEKKGSSAETVKKVLGRLGLRKKGISVE